MSLSEKAGSAASDHPGSLDRPPFFTGGWVTRQRVDRDVQERIKVGSSPFSRLDGRGSGDHHIPWFIAAVLVHMMNRDPLLCGRAGGGFDRNHHHDRTGRNGLGRIILNQKSDLRYQCRHGVPFDFIADGRRRWLTTETQRHRENWRKSERLR